MSNAAAYLDSLLDLTVAVDRSRPPDLPLSELREEALRRLLNPKASGMALVTAWRELREAEPGADEAELWAVVRDESLARPVRARHAELLVNADAERWQELAAELPEEDEALGFEGFLEYELTLLVHGLRSADELARSLGEVPGDWRDEVAGQLERVRMTTGPSACEAYAAVLEDETLATFWPICAEAVAAEPSVEALALLDMALLAGAPSEVAREVRDARKSLLDRLPALRLPVAPKGEAFFDPHFSPAHTLTGLVGLARGKARLSYLVDFDDAHGVDAQYGGMFPAETHRTLAEEASDSVEVPFAEALAMLAEAVRLGGLKGGSRRDLAPLRDALKQAPPLPEVAPAEPFTEGELRALLETPAFAGWVRSLEARAMKRDVAPDKLARALLNRERLDILARRLDRQVHWLRWHGEPELASRLAAHRRLPGRDEEPFRLFAQVWALLFVGG